MSKSNKFYFLLALMVILLTGCLPPSSVTKEDVNITANESREDVIDMMVESPVVDDGLTIIDPENSGVKRQMVEIEGYQKGVKFKDSSWQDYPISLNLNMVPLRKFFELIGELTDLNFIVGEEIKGELTIELNNVSWIEVLEMVLREKNLIHDVNPSGTVVTVHTYEFIAKQSKDYESALTSKIQVINSLSGLETKTTAIFKLNYAKPGVLAEQLKSVIATLEAGGESGSVEQRATFVIDTRTNSLIVQATPSDIEWIKTTIDNLDKPTKQVMVEVFIIEASDGFEQALGSRISVFHKGASNNDLERIS
ncbi:MAG: secretin N-terminal domain-containing protein, partial [Methylophilaceae bacterium]